MEIERRASLRSDEGYNSDHSELNQSNERKTLEREPSEIVKLTTEEIIEKDVVDFKQKYFVEKLINNSANGVIYKGYRKIDQRPVCVKQIPRDRISAFVDLNDGSGRKIPNEFYFHLKAEKSKSVVSIFDWYERKTSFVLVMEYPSNYVDMFEFSQSYGRINEAPAKIIFSNLLQAVRLLIDQQIFHRDLKDENILLNPSTLEVKLIDFGCATQYSDEIHTRLSGTPEFMPPEAIERGEYTAEGATIWSLGVILFTLINGRLPYEDIHNFNNRTEFSSDISPVTKSFVESMMTIDPSSRIRFSDLLNSDWLKFES